MTHRSFRVAAASLSPLPLVYLGWSFVFWNFNPGAWSEGARAFGVVVATFSALMVATIAMTGEGGKP